MTPPRLGGIAVAMLAVGILTGATGAIVVRDFTSPEVNFAAVMADHMAGVTTASMMSGSMMGSGPMMGPGASFDPGMMTGPDVSPMPGSVHHQHHPAASPDGAQ
jgi:hypothetical protein